MLAPRFTPHLAGCTWQEHGCCACFELDRRLSESVDSAKVHQLVPDGCTLWVHLREEGNELGSRGHIGQELRDPDKALGRVG